MLQPIYFQSVAIIIIILNVISFLSLAFVLSIYIYNWKKIASFPMRLSFYLCLSCIGQNFYMILLNPIVIHRETLQSEQTQWFCVLQAILKVGFDLSSIIWTSLIIFSVFASVVLKKKLQSFRIQLLYLIIAFAFPLTIATIPAFFRQYSYNTYFCWFSGKIYNPNRIQQFWLQMGYFFLPLWILVIINITLTTKIYLSLKKIQLQPRLLNIFQRLILFPFIMFFIGLFSTIELIYNYQNQQHAIWLDQASSILLCLYGLFNSIAYGFNPLMWERIQTCFNRVPIQQTSIIKDQNDRSSRSSSSRHTEQLQAQLSQMKSGKQINGFRRKI